MFKEALGVLGCDPKVYGLHSLQSGGITSVVKNDDSKVVSERVGSLRNEDGDGNEDSILKYEFALFISLRNHFMSFRVKNV